MRTDLDHIPDSKRRELERVVQIIFEELADVQLLAQEKRKSGRILKIILYGSFARGDWVDEPYTAKGYLSDYDILVIVNNDDLTDRAAYWYKVEERLVRETTILQTLRTPVNLIIHTLQQVNNSLAQGRYFFMDIVRDGIALYQSDDIELLRPTPQTPDQALAMAKEYFEEWFPAAMKRFEGASFYRERGHLKDAAFDLHQTTERLYHCVLLTCTFYTPHSHNIAYLASQANKIDRRLLYVWPRNTKAERAMFEKLKEAYVKARYSKHYRVSVEDLAWLGSQVEELGRVVQLICSDWIAKLNRDVVCQ